MAKEVESAEAEIQDEDLDQYLDTLDDFDTTPAKPLTKSNKVLEESFNKINSNTESVKDHPNLDGMEQMMQELEGMMQNENFDELFGVIYFYLHQGIMNELISKDLLEEPMRDLEKQYPEWLSLNKLKITEDEFSRYNSQYLVIVRINQVFDKSDKELNSEESKLVTDMMAEMQKFGSPPDGMMNIMNPSEGTDQTGEEMPPECKNM
jgi:peroxin-19